MRTSTRNYCWNGIEEQGINAGYGKKKKGERERAEGECALVTG